LKASNVFCILPYAQKFEDKDLEDRCWKVIEEQTEEAVTSDEFVTVERSLVETVVKREVLDVKEVELFKAVNRWATEESQRQGITPDGESKRRILGEEIVKAIRFPFMSQQEFASVVIDSELLTLKEVGSMMKHYNGVLTCSLPFAQASRKKRSNIHQCQRFRVFNPPDRRWACDNIVPNCITFYVNKPVMLHGVQHFGSEGGNYRVSTEVKDTINGSSLVKQSGSYASEKDETLSYYGFTVLFDRPVCLAENKEYQIESFMSGRNSWYGTEGQTSVDSQGVVFTFSTSEDRLCGGNVTVGQFPVLFWSARR